jgi:hypothetical protein
VLAPYVVAGLSAAVSRSWTCLCYSGNSAHQGQNGQSEQEESTTTRISGNPRGPKNHLVFHGNPLFILAIVVTVATLAGSAQQSAYQKCGGKAKNCLQVGL